MAHHSVWKSLCFWEKLTLTFLILLKPTWFTEEITMCDQSHRGLEALFLLLILIQNHQTKLFMSCHWAGLCLQLLQAKCGFMWQMKVWLRAWYWHKPRTGQSASLASVGLRLGVSVPAASLGWHASAGLRCGASAKEEMLLTTAPRKSLIEGQILYCWDKWQTHYATQTYRNQLLKAV